MSVGLRVGAEVEEVGTGAFLNAFFSTVVALLEDGRRGSRFPALTESLYAGALPAADVPTASTDLLEVREELARRSPGDVVWDVDDPAARPPWGDDISDAITSLADYFVTSDGRDLLDVLLEALGRAETLGEPVTIEAV